MKNIGKDRDAEDERMNSWWMREAFPLRREDDLYTTVKLHAPIHEAFEEIGSIESLIERDPGYR